VVAQGGGEELVPAWAAAPLAPAELLALAGEGVRSEHTRRAYRAGFRALAAFLGVDDEGAAIAALLAAGNRGAQALVVRFRQDLLRQGLAPATVNLRLAAVKSAVRLARLSGTTDWDLAVPAVRQSGPGRETRGPAVADVRRLLAAAASQDSEGKAARDGALLRLLYDLGLRRSEVVGLDRSDVDLRGGGGTLFVSRKGGGGARVVLELPAETAAALAAWLAFRGEGPGALFVELSRGGGRARLAANGLYYVVRRLGEEIGLAVRPHGLRHASITAVLAQAADRGIPLTEVFTATGHARESVRVVIGYYDRGRSRQGELAQLVARTVHNVAPPLATPDDVNRKENRGGGTTHP
jgi:integrase/recombinase XerC